MSQSPELAGGEGFTFEGNIAAYYTAALLAETYAPGISERAVCRVAVQQRDFGEPLDDVIVDFRSPTGEEARLSLQVKRSLTISDAASNKDFRDIIRDSWLTLSKEGFRRGVDRYGAAVGTIASPSSRALTTLCEWARESDTAAHFDARFQEAAVGTKVAGPKERKIHRRIASILREIKGQDCSSEELHGFFAHFVLITFDFMHEGAAAPAEALSIVRQSLSAGDVDKAPLVWAKLVQLARAAAGKAGAFDRGRLLRSLVGTAKLANSASLHDDIEALREMGRAFADIIPDTVGGLRIERPELRSLVDAKVEEARVIYIRGLPGSGKSVLLRQVAMESIGAGPALFLKGDQLDGKSWRGFAAAHGLSGAALPDLLSEIGGNGTATLYIDALDRIEKEQQPVILDLVRAILKSPSLDNWKIVASLRDSGLESTRIWLGDLLRELPTATVNVDILSDEEAEQLAKVRPQLRSLLFGTAQVREIVRRPFFAKILDLGLMLENGDADFVPQSEVDLLRRWWLRGGYDASGQPAIGRQAALVELATCKASAISKPVTTARLSGPTLGLIAQLIEDGILQHAVEGVSVRFAHDIFFEWSFFHDLVGAGTDWIHQIRSCGEPPAVARVVELLSQWKYTQDNDWACEFRTISAAPVRSQWTRAWLLGPVASPRFARGDTYWATLAADDFALLHKALVWFQAEKTTPNSFILEGTLPYEERIRYADLFGWPADFAAWRRFILLLLAHIDAIPSRLYSEILSLFQVWQNALSPNANPVSHAILAQCAQWLDDIDTEREDQLPSRATSRWNDVGKGFKKRLVELILGACASEPEFTDAYLTRLARSADVDARDYGTIVPYSPRLAKSHPALLVDVTLKHLRDELPADQVAREEAEDKAARKMREAALAKPKAERTRHDQMAIDGLFSRIGFNSFSHFDWDHLAIGRDHGAFSPASPLQEPFASLFALAPEEALRSLTSLCNHAMAAWRQLHLYEPRKAAKPIPIVLDFPWGRQSFWGDDREYLWYRGMFAPDPIGCAFMALEEWCFAELERGRSVEVLIQHILKGNECVGALGLAATLALHTNNVSETVLPLLTSQRLLDADEYRMRQELGSSSNLIGFNGTSAEAHRKKIREANARPVRPKRLSDLLAHYYAFGGDKYSDAVRTAVLNFADNPDFAYEEEGTNQEALEYYAAKARKYAELVDEANFYKVPTEDPDKILLQHVSPSASTAESQERAANATRYLQKTALWTWASKTFDSGSPDPSIALAVAIAAARHFDDASLFAKGEAEDNGMPRGAVAAVAAVALIHRSGLDADVLVWARDLLSRARAFVEPEGDIWSAQSHIDWHHGHAVARGLAADIRARTSADGEALLSLIAHPLETVSLGALAQCLRLWDVDPRLGKAGLSLFMALCAYPAAKTPFQSSGRGPIHLRSHANDAVKRARRYYRGRGAWPALPLPPAPWVATSLKADERAGIKRRLHEDERTKTCWAEPMVHWYAQFAAKGLRLVPLSAVFADPEAARFVDFLEGALRWSIAKLVPPWEKKKRHDRDLADISEWVHQLSSTIGSATGFLPITLITKRFLDPMLALEEEMCWGFLNSFATALLCEHIYDAETIPSSALPIADACLTRLLDSDRLIAGGYSDGDLHGYDQPHLARALMFVSVDNAPLAARFANGDWSGISVILPIVDRFVRKAGWSGTIIGNYLTLCERAKAHYPAVDFADQLLTVLAGPRLEGWDKPMAPARISTLIQFFADRDAPLDLALAQKFLRILDQLVDMGDRRAAALQYSSAFREVQVH